MLFRTVGQLKTDIYRNISPAKPSDSKDPNGAIEQAVNDMLGYTKPLELAKRAIIENALYDQVNQFSCPDDLDTNKIMQWYRLKGQQNADEFFNNMIQTTNRAFDQATRRPNPHANIFTIEYQSGKKFIRVSDFKQNTGTTIHDMDSITSNGTWLVGGNLVNLTTDNLTYFQGHGSLRFDLNSSFNVGTMETLGMQSVDLTSYLNVGKVFTWLDLPNLNQLQTVTLDMYSSATDYYSITVSSPHDTDQFQLGTNMLGFAMNRDSMNTIGTPNPAAINKIKFTFTTAGTLNMNSVRIDNVTAKKGSVYGIQYITNQVFQNATTGLMSMRPANDSDLVALEYDTYQLLLAHCNYVFSQELINKNLGESDLGIKELNKAIAIYKKRHKEEFIDETQTMWNFGVPYGYYWGGYGHGYRHGQNGLDDLSELS